MITGLAVYHVVEAMAPLYTAAVLGYASVRWLKAFSEEQCAGINHFVAIYAVPVLIFNMVSTNNPYAMNGRLVAADTLQKAVMLLGLVAWAAWESRSRRRRRRSDDGGGKAAASAAAASPLQWVVTAFSVASLPNTIIMGVPLLGGMYGAMSKDLMKQIVVMQFCVWYNVVIFIYEYMAARRAATAVDGGAKISPGSPGAVPSAEKIATHDEAAVAAKRAHEVTVNIEITEVTPASTTQQKDGPDDTTTTSADAEAEQASSPPAKSTAPSVRHIALMAGKKVLKIPNTYASFLGLIWALIAFKYVRDEDAKNNRRLAVHDPDDGGWAEHVRVGDVHSAAVAVRAVRLRDRVHVDGAQVPDRPGGDAAGVARHRHARHPAAHCCRTGGTPPSRDFICVR
ncbi:probable auxin efflux carrier component 9 isoform X2 [Hordeum vulgare subsp. vulgare]|uniref:probable auxin efflux carrier component 9 isoform X2 n=1 Tax=Hordeum vulgare subsp. vulgare TaxID=112509 RepID=UPI001D1A34DC|nr:probable auxin efflux carrier component 9 isoform X2 [Hordeum vulgare subsp. vulgare]